MIKGQIQRLQQMYTVTAINKLMVYIVNAGLVANTN